MAKMIIKGEKFDAAMRAVKTHVGKDRMNLIEVKYGGGNTATFTGLDGTTLAQITVPVMQDEHEPFVVLIPPTKYVKCGTVEIEEDYRGAVIRFVGTGVEVRHPKAVEAFMDYARVLYPSASPEHEILVNPKLLAKACESFHDGKAITLRFYGALTPFLLSGEDTTCVVCPVRPTE